MRRFFPFTALTVAAALAFGASRVGAADDDLAAQLHDLKADVFPPDSDQARELPRMLARDVQARMRAANVRENQAWGEVKTRDAWETYRDARLQALRASLGRFPPAPKDLKWRVTRTLEVDGYRILDLVFESRPGLIVTANLYAPADPPKSMPGILISTSHHNPKTQGELQDMGMTWARQGCLVLVPDHLGHGERRQHPSWTEKDYPRPFKPGRQDYYYRYNEGLQLQVAGESLMGWMAWDLMRCVDVLLAQPGIDRDRILLLGSVAGGGDSAAVTAALDPRVAAVAPFNFGGPQPDFTTAADAERDFYWFGVSEWESTRCLRLGARDGFAQWLIVASAAPRPLIYGHEFAWDQEHDPAWPRLQKVYGWYDAADRLAVASGKGSLKGSEPDKSEANNIGPLHRSKMYPTLRRWFDMAIPEEYRQRRKADELLCLTPEAPKEFAPRPLYELAAEVGEGRAVETRKRLAGLNAEARRTELRRGWAVLLGDVEPKGDPKILEQRKEPAKGLTVERVALGVGGDLIVPLMLLVPAHKPDARPPVVMGLAQGGKAAFLKERSEAVAELLEGGAAVCLVDVRGTGETRLADEGRGRNSASTDLSAEEWILGQTLVGSRLRDVRSVLRYLRGRGDLDAGRTALWGDSFAPANAADADLAVPLDADPFPHIGEPLGGLLALFGALYEDDVRAVYVRGGLSGYKSYLQSPFGYLPHDAIIPGALTQGDLCDAAAALAPRPLRMDRMIDGLNREISADALEKTCERTRAAYRDLKAESRLQLGGEKPTEESAARWMLRRLVAD